MSPWMSTGKPSLDNMTWFGTGLGDLEVGTTDLWHFVTCFELTFGVCSWFFPRKSCWMQAQLDPSRLQTQIVSTCTCHIRFTVRQLCHCIICICTLCNRTANYESTFFRFRVLWGWRGTWGLLPWGGPSLRTACPGTPALQWQRLPTVFAGTKCNVCLF